MSAITSWAEDDRPREKLLTKSAAALSDAELLAILLGSGTRGESAVALAQRVLSAADNSLHDLGRKSIGDLQKHKGIGQAKALTIAAALELGRRRNGADLRLRPKVTCSRDVYEAIAPHLSDLVHEEFWLLHLNNASEICSREQISTGGLSATVVDVRMVFKAALDQRSSAIIAVHNHPSGALQPSKADLDLTRRLVAGGKTLEIPLLDHVIVSAKGYYSFADEGMLSG